MAKGIDLLEIEEFGKFIEFIETSGRLGELKNLDNLKERTNFCIHLTRDFAVTSAKEHPKIKNHLDYLNIQFQSYREHALKCNRCQIYLDSIYTFTGYENKKVFNSLDTQRLLEGEVKHISKNDLYLCKLTPKIDSDSITYITSVSLEKAIKQFVDTIQKPAELKLSKECFMRKKISPINKTNYFQVYLSTKYGTRIGIRSLISEKYYSQKK